jgi:predicted TIM-barrel fold metal-dependent hydrolase
MLGDGPAGQDEPILEPELPIIDPHHHLWFVPEAVRAAMDPDANPYFHVRRRTPRYLFDELLADLRTGHNIRATMFVECHSMHRPYGPEKFRTLGEVDFANGFAAMGASGLFGDIQVCAGIIGHANLALGDEVAAVLAASIAIAGERYRGVRHVSQHDPDPYFARIGGATPPGLLLDARFREGFRHLERSGLAFDAFLYEPQLPEVLDLARAFPDTTIVINHTGTPLGMGGYAGRREERFALWRENIHALACCENVYLKLGGLGMPVCGFASFLASPLASSQRLADEWRPYMEIGIEAFGAGRCMFESNFPTESGTCTYPVLWNAFKRIAAGASADEKRALFAETAKAAYKLSVAL